MAEFKVLLVDDEEEFVVCLAERLQLRRLDPRVVLSGEDALRAVEDEVPDVMVLDLKMPGIDGMEVLRRVKKGHPHVQVIVLTGHGSERDEEAVRRLGAVEYLRKPVDIDDLIQTLNRAHQQRQRHVS